MHAVVTPPPGYNEFMPDVPSLADRLRGGLLRIQQGGAAGADTEAILPLKRSLERSLLRLNLNNSPAPSPFRFQLTGGKPLLFLGTEALPLEPAALVRLLNNLGVNLAPGESLDLDGELASWLIRPEVTVTDTNLRQADGVLKGLKAGRDRDHVAAQVAESSKIRLRSRLTQLVTALQTAQADAAGYLSSPPVPIAVLELTPPPAPSPVVEQAPPPPPAPVVQAPEPEPAPDPFPPPPQATVTQALRKIVAAVEGSGFKYAVVGHVGCLAHGSKQPARFIELIVAFEGPQRESVLSAARGEGLQPAADDEPLHLQFDGIPVHLRQANSPYHKQVISRAQPAQALQVRVRIAAVEDLMILIAAGDHARTVDLLRANSSTLDAGYLKKEAAAAGVFDWIRAAWGEAKQPK